MKTNAIVRIVCYSLVALLLIAILLAGLGVGQLTFHFGNSGGEPINGELRVDAADVQNIEIEWVSGDITLSVATDGSQQILIRESGASGDQREATWEIRGQTLVIRDAEPGFTLGFTSTQDKDLTVTFPAGWFCNDLDIETVSGSVEISVLSASRIEVEGVSAQCRFSGCTAKDVSISTVSGNVTYLGDVDTLDCKSVSASCEIFPDNLPRELRLESVSGDLIVGLLEPAGFTTALDSVSGKVYSDFSTTSAHGNQTYGDGSCRIHADTVSGDIEIRRMEIRLTE